MWRWLTLIAALVLALTLMAEAWLGWSQAKTDQDKLYWWLGIFGLMLVTLVFLSVLIGPYL